MLVLHGDRFDDVVKFPAWLTKLGDVIYEKLVVLNRYYNQLRTLMGRPYWSLSNYIKANNKSAGEYIACLLYTSDAADE